MAAATTTTSTCSGMSAMRSTAGCWRRSWTIALGVLLLLAAGCSSDDATPTPLLSAAGDSTTSTVEPTIVAETAGSANEPDHDSNSDGEPGADTANETDIADAEPTVVATTAPVEASPSPTPVARPAAPNGRIAPTVATTPAELADQIAQAEAVLQDPASTALQLADAGHLHQVAIRALGYRPDWDIEFFGALPSQFQSRTLLHVSARRALIDLSSGYDAADFIPAWGIVEPEPSNALLSYYRAAEDATGIEWEYLAAINLVETGMGRIRGLSSAGAQGPMQFLPTTWAEAGIGEGDINDPNDAINAAARYLVRRGGPEDMPGAIWGYNNSDDYVTAVRAYAELLRQDPAAYAAIYNWEIYFFTEAGDIWLPTGFRTEEVIDLTDYLAANPWSAPDPGLRDGGERGADG